MVKLSMQEIKKQILLKKSHERVNGFFCVKKQIGGLNL